MGQLNDLLDSAGAASELGVSPSRVQQLINAGRLPGPRLRAASPEITATAGLSDERQMHQNRTGVHQLPAEALYAEPLSVRVAAVN